jgi:hypothetical protein
MIAAVVVFVAVVVAAIVDPRVERSHDDGSTGELALPV